MPTVRVSRELYAAAVVVAGNLERTMERSGALFAQVSKVDASAVIRLAIERGLRVLEGEIAALNGGPQTPEDEAALVSLKVDNHVEHIKRRFEAEKERQESKRLTLTSDADEAFLEAVRQGAPWVPASSGEYVRWALTRVIALYSKATLLAVFGWCPLMDQWVGIIYSAASMAGSRIGRDRATVLAQIESDVQEVWAPVAPPMDPTWRGWGTHRCKVCGAIWRRWTADEQPPEGGWTLYSSTCGKCCDNVEMGDQIEDLAELRAAAQP